MTLNYGEKDYHECKFRGYSDLCFIERLENDENKLKITCSELPCNVYWKFYQEENMELGYDDGGENSLDFFYRLSKK